MRIRLLRPIGYRRVGSELTVADNVGKLWILQNKAARVIASQPEAMVPATPSQSGRGRPKRTASKRTSGRVAMS